MTHIVTFLKKPTSYNTKPWIGILCGPLLVFLLLITLEPYSIKTLNGAEKYFKIASFTTITAISCVIVGYVFPVVFKKFYSPSSWTVGKDLTNHALIVLLITMGNLSLNYVLGHKITSNTGFSMLLFYLLLTLGIGVIAGSITHFIARNYALKRNLHDTKVMNDRLNNRLHSIIRFDTKKENHSVTLSGSTKETISVNPQDILYIESSGNYVIIDYLFENQVKQTKLRTTLNKIEKDLASYTYLLRCHRAYIVNKSYVSDVRGNSQGLQLSLQHLGAEIPVSRSHVELLKENI